MDIEDQLRKALQRREPAPDFTLRVLAEAAKETQKRRARWPREWLNLHRGWTIGPVVAAICLCVSIVALQNHQRALRGRAAKQQLLVALRIAGTELNQAQERVSKIHSGEVIIQ